MKQIRGWIDRYGLWAASVIAICGCVLIANILMAGRDFLQPSPVSWDRSEYLPVPAGGCAGDVIRVGPTVMTVRHPGSGRLLVRFTYSWIDLNDQSVLRGIDGAPLAETFPPAPFDASTVITTTQVLTIPQILNQPARVGYRYTGAAEFAEGTGYTVPVEVRSCS